MSEVTLKQFTVKKRFTGLDLVTPVYTHCQLEFQIKLLHQSIHPSSCSSSCADRSCSTRVSDQNYQHTPIMFNLVADRNISTIFY
jgi:hypothetical protein